MMRVVGSDKVIDKGLSDSIGGPLGEGSSLRFELDNGGPEEWGEHDFGGAKAADRMFHLDVRNKFYVNRGQAEFLEATSKTER